MSQSRPFARETRALRTSAAVALHVGARMRCFATHVKTTHRLGSSGWLTARSDVRSWRRSLILCSWRRHAQSDAHSTARRTPSDHQVRDTQAQSARRARSRQLAALQRRPGTGQVAIPQPLHTRKKLSTDAFDVGLFLRGASRDGLDDTTVTSPSGAAISRLLLPVNPLQSRLTDSRGKLPTNCLFFLVDYFDGGFRFVFDEKSPKETYMTSYLHSLFPKFDAGPHQICGFFMRDYVCR